MSDYTTQQEAAIDYWNSVKAIAQEALDAEKEGNDASDQIHESVDGSEWVIYTWRNLLVLQISSNESAAWDVGNPEASDFSQLMQVLAFYAMLHDCEEALEELRSEQPDPESVDA